MVLDTIKHYPVLLKEIISIITPQYGGTFIDCTFGQGGYSEKILSHKNTQVIALDRDIESKNSADLLLKKFNNRFIFKHKKTQEKVEVVLEHGSLLVMKDVTQSFWLHRLPPTKKVQTPRINLTFRTIDFQ